MKNLKFLTPVVTVLTKEGKLDHEGNIRVWEHLIQNGIDGIVLLGSTGEFFSISMEEKKELIDLAIKHINKRIKLYVGTGCMRMEDTINLSNYALKNEVDAVMIIGPYYFALSPESIEFYYNEVAKKINGDIYIYNFPERTGYDITAELTLNLLKKNKNIVGFKDTVDQMGHTRKLIATIKKEFSNFEIFSGYDENFAHMALSGGTGCIGALSNLYPDIFSKWKFAIENNDIKKISEIQRIVDKLMEIYDIGKPFIPTLKKAMKLRGIGIEEYCIEPFIKSTAEEVIKIKKIIKEVEKEFNKI